MTNELFGEYFELVKGQPCWKKSPRYGITSGSLVGKLKKSGYLEFMFKHKNYYVHRLTWFLYYGAWPNNYIDHVDGNKLNNDINNLRDVTHRENHQNKKCHREGRLIGAHLQKSGKWMAYINIKRKSFYIGSFNTQQEAHEAYMERVKCLTN